MKSYFNVTYFVFCLTSYDLMGMIGGIWPRVSPLLVLLRERARGKSSILKGLRLLTGLSDLLIGLFLRDVIDEIKEFARSALLYIRRRVDVGKEGGAEGSRGSTN